VVKFHTGGDRMVFVSPRPQKCADSVKIRNRR